MRRHIRDIALGFVVLAICLSMAVIVHAMDKSIEVEEPEPTFTVVIVEESAEEPGEDPEEQEKIEAALVEQGYFRDDVPLSRELQDILHTACEANGIPYVVGLGLIETESSFRSDAVSSAGCYGLTQLNPQYFPSDLSDAENIRTGMDFLGYQIKRYDGDLEAALTAYNAGHDTGHRWYAEAVLAAAERWEVTE